MSSAYFNCSSRQIDASHLAFVGELCPSDDWSANSVGQVPYPGHPSLPGYGPDVASLPAKIIVVAPSVYGRIIPPIKVSLLDQSQQLIVKGDIFPMHTHSCTAV